MVVSLYSLVIYLIVLKSVRRLRHELGRRYIWNKSTHYRIMIKLDLLKVRYIIRQKKLGRSTKDIVVEMEVCEIGPKAVCLVSQN